MSILHRILLRDLWRLRGPLGAIIAVMACGVATFVMSLSMLHALGSTLEGYYDAHRFGHVFVSLERAPRSIAHRLAEIPGVAAAEARVVEAVTLRVPGATGTRSARVVSLPADPATGLHTLHLRTGRLPVARGGREVVVSEAFAAANGLGPGSPVSVVLDGRLQTFRIVGVGLSPEFIYLLAPGSILPDDERFGVLWMAPAEVAAAFDMDGACNDVVLRLVPGVRNDPTALADVIDAVDAATATAGGLGAYDRDDQPSHAFADNELKELRGMAVTVPLIFLGVAAVLLHIVLGRLVDTQREQIAVLRALGRTRREIGVHYAALVVAVSFLAALVGTAAGAWMGHGMTALYAEFFRFPSFDYTLPAWTGFAGFAAALAAAAVGVVRPVATAMRLAPAEAMRPRPPASFRPTILARLGIHRRLSPAARMVLRQLERHPGRALTTSIGIALAAAILVIGGAVQDGIASLVDLQFDLVQRYDVNVVMHDRADESAARAAAVLPGVTAVEPYRVVAARIQRGAASRRTAILGLDRASGLHRLLDIEGRDVPLPAGGLLLSEALAISIGAAPGDTVTVTLLQDDRRTVAVPVGGLIRDMAGTSAYMRRTELATLAGDPQAISGLYLAADPTDQPALDAALRDVPRVAAVNLTSAVREQYTTIVARNLLLMQRFLLLFAVVIAFGVVYNGARISLAERARDLATLRVIGFSRREITSVQLGELAVLVAAAIPLGLAAGYAGAFGVSVAMRSELVRLPFVVHDSTYALAAAVVVAAAAASGLLVARRLGRLDLVSVLKSRE